MMTKAERKRITGGLGSPSKMPGKSYGLPAEECKLGAILARKAGSVCEGCYALKGRYVYPSVKIAQARRLAALRDPRWEATMVESIRAEVDPADPFFRWHDSGDLQSADHLAAIARIARALPHVRFWLPTRETTMVREWLATGAAVPRNLVIRVSAAMVGQSKTLPASWRRRGIVTSSVDAGRGHRCPAPTQGNQCGDCRACWSRLVPAVDYELH